MWTKGEVWTTYYNGVKFLLNEAPLVTFFSLQLLFVMMVPVVLISVMMITILARPVCYLVLNIVRTIMRRKPIEEEKADITEEEKTNSVKEKKKDNVEKKAKDTVDESDTKDQLVEKSNDNGKKKKKSKKDTKEKNVG